METTSNNANLLSQSMIGLLKGKKTPPMEQRVLKPDPSVTEEKLTAYVRSLQSESTIDSINAHLEAEHNTPDSAAALCGFYRGRPNLKSFTLAKEVPRMGYEIALEGGRTLADPEGIQAFFGQHRCDENDELILRASNQSLMADLLAVLMGDNAIVRRQYLATAVARKCRIFINMRTNPSPRRKYVKFKCELLVSIPGGSDGKGRLNLALVDVSALFSPGSKKGGDPLLRYEVHNIRPCLHPKRDSPTIRAAATSLAMHLHHDRLNTHHAPTAEVSASTRKPRLALGFDKMARKPRFDLASKFRSVVDTLSVIDEQAAAIAKSKAPRRQSSKSGASQAVNALQPFSGANMGDFMVEQLIIEQQLVLSQCEASIAWTAQEKRNESEMIRI